MSGVSRAVVSDMAKKGKAALDAAGAALGNEMLTRQRVDRVEALLYAVILPIFDKSPSVTSRSVVLYRLNG